MNFLQEIVVFVISRKKYFLAPIIFVALMLGGLFVLSSGSAVAPFIYALF